MAAGESGGGLYDTDGFPVELLPSDNLLWPQPLSYGVQSVELDDGVYVNILKPAAILFGKVARAFQNLYSDRPLSHAKYNSDVLDITFLLDLVWDTDATEMYALYTEDQQERILAALQGMAPYIEGLDYIQQAVENA